MLTPLSSDSDPQMFFRPLPGSADAAPPLPVFDLEQTDAPLPAADTDPDSGWSDPEANIFAEFAAPELPTFDDLERQAAQNKASPTTGKQQGALWLEGDVLMIACPDCSAPMAVRIWLMAADCWNCGISIELSEDQEREAERLLAERDRKRQKQVNSAATATKMNAKPAPSTPPTKPAGTSASTSTTKSPGPKSTSGTSPQQSPATRPTPSGGTATKQAPPAHKTAPTPSSVPTARRNSPAAPSPQRQQAPTRRTPTASQPSRMQNKLRRQAQSSSAQVWLSERLKETPAWLLSMIIHLVMLTLLGLLNVDDDDQGPRITISSAISREVQEGEVPVEINPTDELNFELPITEKDRETLTREALVKADQEARQLQLGAADAVMQLAPVESVKNKLRNASPATRALAARDPRLRVEVVKQEGGTTLTEAAVSRGLRWLASQQRADGRWRLDGSKTSDPAATSLALLPFLGAGQTHLVGRYQNTVSKGLRWLVDNQQDDGDLSAGSDDSSRMYAHGQCAIVLSEAFAMTGDEELRVPAQKAIDFIIRAQHHEGGWRYEPREPGDTSVVGWQVMALQSARAANLSLRSPIGVDVLENANRFLDSVSHADGSQYSYLPNSPPTEVMTAEGLLCRMYLGWNKSDPGLVQGVEYLNQHHLPSNNKPNFYYWYYGTQVFHHSGGEAWENWNLRMREILVERQITSGNNAGSWNPAGKHGSAGGRIYVTSLAICTLEVYYRHTPIFRQLELD